MQEKVKGFAPKSQNNFYFQRPSSESHEFFVYFATNLNISCYYYRWIAQKVPKSKPSSTGQCGSPSTSTFCCGRVQACWQSFAHALNAHLCKFPQLEGPTGLLPKVRRLRIRAPESLSLVHHFSCRQCFTKYYFHAI